MICLAPVHATTLMKCVSALCAVCCVLSAVYVRAARSMIQAKLLKHETPIRNKCISIPQREQTEYIRMEEVAFVPKALASANVNYYMAVCSVCRVCGAVHDVRWAKYTFATLCSVCECVFTNHESTGTQPWFRSLAYLFTSGTLVYMSMVHEPRRSETAMKNGVIWSGTMRHSCRRLV